MANEGWNTLHATVVWNSCIRVLTSAESAGSDWRKIAIATKLYQFHATDKCGFLFMLLIADKSKFRP